MSTKQGVDASRRVPKDLNKSETFRGYSRDAFIMIIVPTTIGIIVAGNVPAQYSSYGPIFIVLGFLSGLFIVFVTPDHLEPTEWLESIGHYIRRPKQVRHISLAHGMAREQKDYADSKFYEMNERTQEITWVKRIHKHVHAVEREDGALVGGVKVEPTNMALASQQSWDRLINEWENYLNNSVEYPVQIYATSSPFPVNDYVSQYHDRINDPDIAQRPILRELLKNFLSWYPQYLQYQGTNQREFYLIFAVQEDEVYGMERDEEPLREKILDIPGIGSKLKPFLQTQTDKSEGQKKAEMLRELTARLREAERQGIQPLTGCSARRLSAMELAILIKEYWQGRQVDLAEEDGAVSANPMVARSDEPPVSPEETATDTGYGGTTGSELDS